MSNSNEIKKETLESNESNRIQELENQIKELQNLIANIDFAKSKNQQPNDYNQEVSIICNVYGGIHVKFPTWTLIMSGLGSRTVITKLQFQELVNSHRKYFQREYILLDPKYIELADQFDVPIFDPDSKKFINVKDLNKVADMDVRSLEDYYSNLSEPMQRTFLNWYMGKCYDKTKGFYSVDKMNALNNLTQSHLFDMLIKLCIFDNQNQK